MIILLRFVKDDPALTHLTSTSDINAPMRDSRTKPAEGLSLLPRPTTNDSLFPGSR